MDELQLLSLLLHQPVTRNQIPNFFVLFFVAVKVSKRVEAMQPILISNCDKNKSQPKEIWYLSFSYRLIQQKKRLICNFD